MEGIADDRQMGVAAVPDAFGGEAGPHPEDLMHTARETLPAVALAPPGGWIRADHGVSFHPDHEGHLYQLEPRKPVLADKLPVHRQRTDVRAWQDGKHVLHECDAVAAPGIAALSAFGKNPPSNGQAHAVEDDADHQDVDVVFSKLPVGAVHRQDPVRGEA